MLRHLFLGVAFAAAAFMVAGCGTESPGAPFAAQQSALQAWAAFPVDTVPRPIVLVGPTVVDPKSGFAASTSKLAYLERAVDLPATFPAGPATVDGYPIVSAAAAAQAFMSTAGKGLVPGTRLTVTAVVLGTARFKTDRTNQVLPAWQLWFAGVTDPAAVLAVAPNRIFQASAAPTRGAQVTDASLAAGGRRLTVGFVGMPPGSGPCTADDTVTAVASHTAVAVTIHERPHGGAGTACALIGYHRLADVTLAEPLGARVVVDALSGSAVPVSISG